MPLSDHEQRILDEIEKNLYQEDPAFARQVKKRDGSGDPKSKARLGALCFAGGFVGLLMFFYTSVVIVGVIAFAAMVLGVVLIAGAFRMAAPSRDLVKGPADRMGRFFSDWEERVRQRYKKD